MTETKRATTNERIAAVLAEVKTLKATARNQHFSYSYVPLSAIYDHVRPLLARNQLVVLHREVECTLEKGTMKLACEFALAGPDDGPDDVHWERRTGSHAVRTIQNQAALASFLVRGWLIQKLMLSTGDEEADGAPQPKQRTAPPKRDASRDEKLRRIENGREKLGWTREELAEVSGEHDGDLDAILKRLGEEWKAQQDGSL